MAVLDEVADLRLDPLLAPRWAAFEAGRPRGNLGMPPARLLRTLATAERTALISACRTWNVQTWCGPAPQTAAIGSGYNDEPSVVIPWRTKPRASK